MATPPVPFFTFDNFHLQMWKGRTSAMDLTVDPLSVYLTNTTPNRETHTKKADLPDITAKNGYTGMTDLVITSRGIVSNQYVLIANDVEWMVTAATDGTGVGPFRYAVLVNKGSSATDSERLLIGYWSWPSAQTVAAGYPIGLDFSGLLGALRSVSSST